jgi:hypothetical protein
MPTPGLGSLGFSSFLVCLYFVVVALYLSLSFVWLVGSIRRLIGLLASNV